MFTFADIFAGIGGFRIALEKLGGKCIFSCEIDKSARKVYIQNFNDIPAGDIRELELTHIPNFDILCAGFPCQPFSFSGKKLGFNDPKNGDLFFYVLKIANKVKPKVIFLENVKHLLNHKKGETFEIIKKSLEDLNYIVFHKVLNAKNFVLAQHRERLFIVAIRKDFEWFSNFEFPQPKKDIKVVEDILDKEDEIPDNFYFQDLKKVIYIRNDINRKIHKPYQIAYINKGRQGERIYSIKGTSITISYSSGGVFARTGGYKTHRGIRKLTINECKRLFGFPEKFSFEGVSYNRAIALLGNSVPINVVSEIGKNILEVLGIKT